MTDYDKDIASLQAEIKSLYEIVKTGKEAEVEARRSEVLTSIASLSAEIGQDFNVDEYKEASLNSLFFNKQLLEKTIKTLKSRVGGGDLAGIVARGDDITELSAEELEDVLTDLVGLAFGLSPAPDEIKEIIRIERMAEGYELIKR